MKIEEICLNITITKDTIKDPFCSAFYSHELGTNRIEYSTQNPFKRNSDDAIFLMSKGWIYHKWFIKTQFILLFNVETVLD